MSSFPLTIHSAEQVRLLDRFAIDTLGIPGYTLMCRAAETALGAIKQRWPRARRITVLCGPGNNGGDGYVFARLAQDAGLDVRVIAVVSTADLRGDALRAFQDYSDAGGSVFHWDSAHCGHADVIVDAIFGTGLSRPVNEHLSAVIDSVNSSGIPILSIDIPSGLHADSGAVLGTAIHADATITFLGLKLGFYLGEGPNHIGHLMFNSLALPGEAFSQAMPSAIRIDSLHIEHALPPRVRTSHKGMNGDVLIVGGGLGMAGAARLAGEAALRSGAGRVTVATHPQNVAAIVSGRPELMCRGVETPEALRSLMERADVLAIGPGLGQDDWAQQMWTAAAHAHRPTVLDADALNLLARDPSVWKGHERVLTPHPGEASRLLNLSTTDVQKDRFAAARTLADRFEGVSVLKGACTIVTAQGRVPAICDRGNPGMASPGMGDVLTGIIAGVLAQLQDVWLAAQVGVWVHASAGDEAAAKRGERGLIASDLFEYLGSCVNPTAKS
jgi:ADP-dependent NAD(P)H-hydrate dehydratase / NAD(P)H-hydrate epimerase